MAAMSSLQATLVGAMRAHATQEHVVVEACAALEGFAATPQGRQALHQAHASEATLMVLRAHAKDGAPGALTAAELRLRLPEFLLQII